MSISGGRCRWARTLALSAAGGILVQFAAGCGGRTSMLDGDLYGSASNGVADGGSGGGQSLPGSGGFIGSGAASGAPTSAVVSACSNYCPGYGTQCINRLNGQDCLRACETEMTSFGQKCQTLGLKALACLAPFFTVNGVNCDAAVKRALGKCTKEVAAFNDCKNKPAPPPR